MRVLSLVVVAVVIPESAFAPGTATGTTTARPNAPPATAAVAASVIVKGPGPAAQKAGHDHLIARRQGGVG